MKTFIKVENQFIPIPPGGFKDGGWYGGRQYFMGEFGEQGKIIIEHDDKLHYKKVEGAVTVKPQ